MSSTPPRFERQADLVPRERLADVDVSVIGVGAIGRQVALQLAALGAAKLQLVDFDKIEPTNVTTQGYLQADLGQAKVTATASAIRLIDPEIAVTLVEDRYRPQHTLGSAVFCCVDSIDARGAIWRSAGRRCRFWCDGRMLGEIMRILTVADDQGRSHYPTTLFQQSEAQTGTCARRGVIYTASIAAGLMVHQFVRWLRDLPIDPDLSLNLLASELTAD
jgi:sulfur carrier protein ThiS adenylyltransferase